MSLKYTPPSQCEACVPVVSYGDWITEYAHETACPERKPKP